MNQLELFNTGPRDEAIERVAGHANPDWLTEAMDTVISMAIRLDTFTTDDVWDHLASTGVTTHEPRAMGAVMVSAQRLGWVTATSHWRVSRRRSCHSRPLRVWKSLVSHERE